MKTYPFLALLLLLSLVACKDEDQPTPGCFDYDAGTRFFEFQMANSDQVFIAATNNAAVIQSIKAELNKPFDERFNHINGDIERVPTDCTTNLGWSWHFVPNAWTLAEISIEVCDATPQYVEENLDTFLPIGYCPWGARVKREVERPD